MTSHKSITTNPWDYVKKHTTARIALGHVGGSLPTAEFLRLQADHASARDAVHSVAELGKIHEHLSKELGIKSTYVKSRASDRQEYLLRPDLGRQLHPTSREVLLKCTTYHQLAIIVADGLSATAINLHAVSLLREIFLLIENKDLSTHVILAKEARVALGDEIGEILKSSVVVMLIGERPGLSNSESIGAYITYSPTVGRTDAERNCISNISPNGLPLKNAAEQLVKIILCAIQYRLTGVSLSGKISQVPIDVY